MKTDKINLTEKKRNELKELHRTTRDGKKRDKIKVILLFADGYSKSEIDRILLIDRKTIGRYLKKYIMFGINGFLKNGYKGYNGKLTEDEIQILRKELNKKIYLTAKEVCEYVKKTFNKKYRAESMVKLLNKIGFSYKKRLFRNIFGVRAKKYFSSFLISYYNHIQLTLFV